MDRIGRDCRDRTDDIHLHPCATTRMPPLGIVNLAERGSLFRAPPGSRGQHNRQAKEFPNPGRAPPTRQAYHGHLSDDTGWTVFNSKQPLVAGNRNGEKCRGTRGGVRPDMRAVGVLAKIATHRCRPGLSVRPIRFTEASGTPRIFAKCLTWSKSSGCSNLSSPPRKWGPRATARILAALCSRLRGNDGILIRHEFVWAQFGSGSKVLAFISVTIAGV